ncbi:septal ring factor EnvC (AmiA/AmiB activator) [Deinobacterium chartae]|uniref:Septal ring factor EnvC (AmiA/AmiB activator) n=1 Tax=Deinobacterium chartae TaxID=521158 RepID=A0A841HX85_9DEIO|nr:peptidoglycan DD-metalloendopeptidase family protein [Deinobacterium chartae]MBB6097254.1 septal ring factor EnvC (AmiA/AmiB activator) [Deinobacterium chartae]
MSPRLKRRAAWMLLSLSLLGSGPAQTLNQLQQQLEQAREAREVQDRRIRSLQQEINRLSARQKQLGTQLSSLEARIARLENERLKVEEQLKDTQARVADVNSRIAVTEARVARQKLQVQKVMLQLYRDRSGRYVKLLSQEDNIYDILIKARYLDRLGRQDLEVIEELRGSLQQLDTQKQELLALTERLNALQRDLVARTDRVQAERDRQQSTLAELRRTAAGRQQLLLQTAEAQRDTQARIGNLFNAILAERARIEEERRRREEEERKRREEERRRLEAQRRELERQRLEAQRREEERRRLEAQRAAAASREAAARQAEQARLERARLEREAAAVRQREQQLEQQERQAAAASSRPPLPASVGRLSFPMPGGRVVRRYGQEGPYELIAGPAPGSPVQASAEGEVLQVQYYAATGWVVLIRHSDSLATSYSGLQQPVVSAGDRVARNQLLGYTGGSPSLDPESFQFSVAALRNNQLQGWVAPNY